MNVFMRRFDEFEDELIRIFQTHPFFHKLTQISNEAFTAYLLQRAFLSLEFEKWELRALLGLSNTEAKKVVRNIIREEVPSKGPLNGATHKELLLHDLNRVGVSTLRFMMTRPSFSTRETLHQMYQLLEYPQEHYDLKVLVALRVAGEVMVAETYRNVTRELKKRFGISEDDSLFYGDHFHHDKKPEKDEPKTGHTVSFERILEDMIVDDETLKIACESAQRAMEMVYHFHDQFLASVKVRHTVSFLAKVAVAASLLFSVGYSSIIERTSLVDVLNQNGQTISRLIEQSDVSGIYLNADQYLVRQFQETSIGAYLEKVGTREAVHAVWGNGP